MKRESENFQFHLYKMQNLKIFYFAFQSKKMLTSVKNEIKSLFSEANVKKEFFLLKQQLLQKSNKKTELQHKIHGLIDMLMISSLYLT